MSDRKGIGQTPGVRESGQEQQANQAFSHLHPDPIVARVMAHRLQQRRRTARAAQPEATHAAQLDTEPTAETREVTTDPAPQHHADQLSVDEALARLLGARATLQADPHNLQEARQLADPVGPWMRRLTSTENVGRHFGGRPGFDAALQSLGFAEEALIGLIQRLHIGAAALPDRRWEHDLSQIAAMRELLRVLAGELPVEKSALAGALDSATRAGVHLAHGTAMVALGPLALAASAELAVAGGTKILTLALTNPILTNELGLFAAGAALQIASAGGLIEHLHQFKSPFGAMQAVHDAMTIWVILKSGSGGPAMFQVAAESIEESSVIRGRIREPRWASGAVGNGPSAQVGNDITVAPEQLSSALRATKGDAQEAQILHESSGFSIKDINPGYPMNGRTENCANCAIATDATLSGAPACALPGTLTPAVALNKAFGIPLNTGWVSHLPDPDAIKVLMKGYGPGSRGVVSAKRPNGQPGHFFNVANQDGDVNFFDGQSARIPPFSEFTEYYVLITHYEKRKARHDPR